MAAASQPGPSPPLADRHPRGMKSPLQAASREPAVAQAGPGWGVCVTGRRLGRRVCGRERGCAPGRARDTVVRRRVTPVGWTAGRRARPEGFRSREAGWPAPGLWVQAGRPAPRSPEPSGQGPTGSSRPEDGGVTACHPQRRVLAAQASWGRPPSRSGQGSWVKEGPGAPR